MLICPMPLTDNHVYPGPSPDRADTVGSKPRGTLLSLLVIALLSMAVYSNTLNSPLLWDEREFLLGNPVVQDLSYYADVSKAEDAFQRAVLTRRYFGYLSFALNYSLHEYEPMGYHIVNSAIHMISSWLVFALALSCFSSTRLNSALPGRTPLAAALFAAALFAAHPLQTEAVTYVFQRLASMTAMFYLLSVISYAYSARAGSRVRAIFLYAVSIIAALVAMKTKESAFTLPFAITLYDLVFLPGAWDRRAVRLAPFVPMLLIVPLSMGLDTGQAASQVGSYMGLRAAQEGHTAHEYLITQSRVMGTYLRMLFAPVGQNLDHDYPLYRDALAPTVLGSIALIGSLVTLGAMGIKKFIALPVPHAQAGGTPSGLTPFMGPVGFGIIWFFLALSVESSIIPIPMLIDEYRLYLPMAGWSIAMASVAAALYLRAGTRKKAVIALCVLIVLALGLTAYMRNTVWQSRISLWQDVVEKSPLKLRGYNNLANAYMDAGMKLEAMETYKNALSPEISLRAPERDLSELHYNLAAAYAGGGEHRKATGHYKESVSIWARNVDAYNNMGLSQLALKDFDSAIASYRKALMLDPGYSKAYFNIGEAYYEKYLQERPPNRLLLSMAAGNYEIFQTLMPEYNETYTKLAVIYEKMGDKEKAGQMRREIEGLR